MFPYFQIVNIDNADDVECAGDAGNAHNAVLINKYIKKAMIVLDLHA